MPRWLVLCTVFVERGIVLLRGRLSRGVAIVGIVTVALLATLSSTMSANDALSANGPPSDPGPVAPTSAQQGCQASLKLILRPGQHWPGSKSPPIPADLPPGNVTVHLPLYPGAQIATRREKNPGVSYTADPYLKSTSVEYQTSDVLDAVIAWYQAAFAGCGYTLQSRGTRSVHGRVVSHWIVWIRKSDRDQFWMSLSFASASDGSSRIFYAAIVYTPPVYPAPGSILRVPGSPTSLTITRYSGLNPGFGALQPLRIVTVTNLKEVESLAAEINKLPKVTPEVMHCPFDDSSHLTLVFGDVDGLKHVVTVNLRGCQFVVARPAPTGRLYDDPKLLPRLLGLVNGPSSRRASDYYDARTLRIVHAHSLAANGGRFLSTGQNGQHVLYLVQGDLLMAPADGGKARLLAHEIADASFGIDDFVVLARQVHAENSNNLMVIDTRTSQERPLHLPVHTTLIGRNAGMGQPGLSDSLDYNLQFVWYVENGRLGGIDPLHPVHDRITTASFLPPHATGRLLALSCTGSLVAVYQPRAGIAIYDVGFSQGGGGKGIRRFAATAVSFLSWAPDDIHLAYRSGDGLFVADVTSGVSHRLLSLDGQTIRGAAWDPWNHVLALALTPTGAPAWESHVQLVNADGSGSGTLLLPFSGATELRWSSFRGQTIGITRVTPDGSEAWVVSLPPTPRDVGQRG